MQTSDVAGLSNSATDDERQAKLRAAAMLMRNWVRTQRTPGAGPVAAVRERLEAHAAPAPPLVFRTPAAEAPAAPAVDQYSEPVAPSLPSFLQDAVEAPEPEPVQETPRRTGPLIPRELLTWLVRAAAVAVVAAVLVGISWTARRAWSSWKSAPNVGIAQLESDPPGATVLIDGEEAGTTPLTKELPAGPHRIEFRNQNATRLIPVEIVKGQSTTTRVDWNVRLFGRLKVQSTPEGAQILIDGKGAGITPATIDDVPVGNHTVTLKTDSGTLQRTVTIAEGAMAELNESIFSGWLHVSSPIALQITNGTKVIRLDDRNQALVPPGRLKLRFQNTDLGYSETRTVEVKPGATTSIDITPALSSISVLSTQPAEVLIDGQRAGETPLEGFAVALGTRDITVTSATGGVRRQTVTVTVEPVRIEVDFGQP